MTTADLKTLAAHAPWTPTREAIRAAGAKPRGKGNRPAESQPQAVDAPAVDELLPMRLVSTQNVREHWGPRGKRNKAQCAALRARLYGRTLPAPPVVVTFTRVAPAHRQLDSDNNTAAFKWMRDTIAKLYGLDDADERLRFVCEQAVGEYGVRLRIERNV
jgi:hypothetical protein